jgi:hypothetical protein
LLFSVLFHKNEYIPGVLSFKSKFLSKIDPPYCAGCGGEVRVSSSSHRFGYGYEAVRIRVNPIKKGGGLFWPSHLSNSALNSMLNIKLFLFNIIPAKPIKDFN